MEFLSEEVKRTILSAGRLWLFLDYDGTLADFLPTPDVIEPEPEVIRLIRGFAENPLTRITIISGRRLSHILRLVPVDGIWIAGTYGVEYRQPDGIFGFRVPYEDIRPTIDRIKPRLEDLLRGTVGFYLEDKGWALAIHARFADLDQAEDVLEAAKTIMTANIDPNRFRILGGYRFLEVSPKAAGKGHTVEWLLQRDPAQDHLLVCLGDDDKDEEAFAVIKQHGGLAILVSATDRQTLADSRLSSPQAARTWLQWVLEHFNQRAGIHAVGRDLNTD